MSLKELGSMSRLWKQLLLLTLVMNLALAGLISDDDDDSDSGENDDIEQRLKTALLELGFPNGTLPTLVPAFGNYVDVVEVNKLLFLSSAAPQTPAGTFVKGRVPNEVNATQAVIAAKLACVRQVNRLKTYLGNLNQVKKIVFVKGKILTQPDFTGHTAIVDGCSAFLVYVFGEEVGKHARTLDGQISTSFNVTMEFEMIAQRR